MGSSGPTAKQHENLSETYEKRNGHSPKKINKVCAFCCKGIVHPENLSKYVGSAKL